MPAWGAESKIIVGALGTFITVTFPLVNGQHAKADAERSKGAAIAQSGFTALHVVAAPPVRLLRWMWRRLRLELGMLLALRFWRCFKRGLLRLSRRQRRLPSQRGQRGPPSPSFLRERGAFFVLYRLLWKSVRIGRALTELRRVQEPQQLFKVCLTALQRARYIRVVNLNQDEITRRLRAARFLRDLSQEDLGDAMKALGAGKMDAGRIERGQMELTPARQWALCQALHVPEYWWTTPNVDR